MDYDRLLKRRAQTIKIKLTQILSQDLALASLAKITITNVLLDRAMEHATVYYVPFPGDEMVFEKELKTWLSYIYQRLKRSIDAKKCPQLKFVYDRGIEHASKIDQILKNLND